MAKIDIAVPCYNYGRFLEACVRSVLDQSIRDVRVLIIDDASADNTVSVARKLAESDARVSFTAHPRNWGPTDTYNQGIEWASAEYFLLLSADDLLTPGALERATGIMDANPDIVLTYGECFIWHDNLPLPKIDGAGRHSWTRHNLIREICTRCKNVVGTPSAIARTSVQKAIGGYRACLPHTGDLEMWLRFAAHGVVAKIDAVQAISRMHSSNMSTSYYASKLLDIELRKRAFDVFFQEDGHLLPDARVLQRQAIRVLAEKVFWVAIIELLRGRVASCRQLLRYAWTLDGIPWYRPPLRRAPAVFGESAARLFGRARRALLSAYGMYGARDAHVGRSDPA